MKQLLAEKMRELSASSQYRKCIAEMNRLKRTFSTVRHVHIYNPSDQTIEMLETEGFKVEKTKVQEYKQFKVEW